MGAKTYNQQTNPRGPVHPNSRDGQFDDKAFSVGQRLPYGRATVPGVPDGRSLDHPDRRKGDDGNG